MFKRIAPSRLVYAWLIFAIASLFYAYEYVLRILPSLMSSELMRFYGMTAATFGHLTASYYYAYTPMQLPVGFLMDRFGPRALLTVACLVCAVGTALFAMTLHIEIAAFGRFLTGFGSAFAFVGILKLGSVWLPPRQFGLVAGFASALGTLGATGGDIILQPIIQACGWRETSIIMAVLGLTLSVSIVTIIRNKPASTKISSQPLVFSDLIQGFLTIIKNRQIWYISAVGCLLYTPTTILAEVWGIPYLHAVRHLTATQSAFCVSLIFFGGTIGAPLSGFLSDRFERRRLPLIISALGALLFSLVILYLPPHSHFLLYTLFFLLGLFYAGQAIIFVLIKEAVSESMAGTAMAATNMFVMLGGMVLQPWVGTVLDWTWDGAIKNGVPLYSSFDYQVALAVLPVALFFSLIFSFFIKEK